MFEPLFVSESVFKAYRPLGHFIRKKVKRQNKAVRSQGADPEFGRWLADMLKDWTTGFMPLTEATQLLLYRSEGYSKNVRFTLGGDADV